MAINIVDYIEGLFNLEIVENEVFILEKVKTDNEPFSTNYVVSSTDLYDTDTQPAVKDKEFHFNAPCMMFAGLSEKFKSEYLSPDVILTVSDSPYTGQRWKIYRKNK